MDLRTMPKAELKGKRDGEYILGVDVARSENNSNNQCSISVLKVKRNKRGRVSVVQLVNLINISSALNFQSQAREVMKIRNLYNAKACIIDGNGIGSGLVDSMCVEQIDPETGDVLGCYKTMNTDAESERDDAEEIIYDLKAQGINTDIIVNFIDYVDSAKLQLLQKKTDVSYDPENMDYYTDTTLPFVQTDQLLEELANLKIKQLSNSRMTVEQQVRNINKDRYSSTAYGLWYIKNFEDGFEEDNSNSNISDFLMIN